MTQEISLAAEPDYHRFADAFVVCSAAVVSIATASWLSLQLDFSFWATTGAAFAINCALVMLHLLMRGFVHARGGINQVHAESHGSSGNQIDFAGLRAFWSRRPLALACVTCAAASAFYVYTVEGVAGLGELAGLIIFLCAAISSTVGFAFSALAGSMLFHFVPDTVHAVRIMLVASIAIQAFSVWKLRQSISLRSLAPYLAGGTLTTGLGVYLLLMTPTRLYFLALGVFLVAYGAYTFTQQPIRIRSNSLFGRLLVGGLGGITGATAAFPGAFITIWCGLHGWDKKRQRAIYQPYILAMQLLTLSVLAASTSAETIRLDLLLYGIPAIVGAYVGLRVFEYLSTGQFNKLVSLFLVLSGVLLSLKAL